MPLNLEDLELVKHFQEAIWWSCMLSHYFDFVHFFLIISHYAQNVTLSSMSHLVYITLFGETDGVILSRLGCTISYVRTPSDI